MVWGSEVNRSKNKEMWWRMWEKLRELISGLTAVLGVQMCILRCLRRSSAQFTSSGASWRSSPAQPCLFHRFANPVCSPILDVSAPALYRGEQSAGQRWLVEHLLSCVVNTLVLMWRDASAWWSQEPETRILMKPIHNFLQSTCK